MFTCVKTVEETGEGDMAGDQEDLRSLREHFGRV